MNENIIYGRNPVLEALKSDAEINTIYINGEGGTLGKIRAEAKKKRNSCKKCNKRKA